MAVGLRGPDDEVGPVARVRLPDVLAPAGQDRLAPVAARLAADGARGVVVLLYSDEPDPRDAAHGLRVTRPGPAACAVEAVRRSFGDLGPVSVWLVTGDRYLGPDCRDPGCCPPGGSPVADLRAGALAAGIVRARDARTPDRRGGLDAGPAAGAAGARETGCTPTGAAEPAPAASGPRRSAAAARSRWVDAQLRLTDPREVLAWRRRSLDTWRAAVAAVAAEPARGALPDADTAAEADADADADADTDADAGTEAPGAADADPGDEDASPVAGVVAPRAAAGAAPPAEARRGARGRATGPGPVRLGRIEAALDDRVVRDAILLTVVEPGTELADALLAQAPDAPAARDARGAAVDPAPRGDQDGTGGPTVTAAVRRALDVLVEPRVARQPSVDTARAARAVLEQVVAHGRRDRQAPARTLLAVLAWWEGDAVRAYDLVERALGDDPGYRLAEILGGALHAGLPPGWMRRRC